MKKFKVVIKPGSKFSSVEKIVVDDDIILSVKVKSLPIEGQANEETVTLLADYFGVPKTDVEIISGFKSRNKIVSVEI